jgi:transglutaminase-like putative cysteine protease
MIMDNLKVNLFHSHDVNTKGVPKKVTVTNSLLLTLALGAYLNSYYQLRIHIFLIFILTVTFVTLIFLFDVNKKNVISYLTIVGVLVLFALIGRIFKIHYITGIKNIYNWCYTYNGDNLTYNKLYSLGVMMAILLISCLIMYLFHCSKKINNVIAIILPVLLVYCTIQKIEFPKLTIGIIIYYSLTVIVEYCGKLFYKSKNTVNNSIATIYLAPACIIIAFASIILPSKPDPIKWNGVKHFIANVKEQTSIWMTQMEYFIDRTGREFSVTFSGYSDENQDELGGSVKEDNKTTLIITTQNKSTSRGYLIGSIRDTYTGRSWEKSNYENNLEKEDYYYDFYELLLAFSREKENGKDLTNIVKKRNFDIEFHDIRTRSIFYPLKTYDIIFRKYIPFKETKQGALLYNKAKGVGTKYKVQYYELNLNDETFQNILRNKGVLGFTPTESELKEVAEEIFEYNTTTFGVNVTTLLKDLEKRADTIRTYYTQLPDSLPERVKQLAIEITKGYNNDYDKLKALESYLNTLKYNTKVSETPKGEDFVDYFLFEQQQGYCTYFATAFGIMARCIGIPTRYIEGFVVDYKVVNNNYIYEVRSNNAHSWIDAYIEGIGWIPFEPTPSFYSGRYTKWRDLSKASDYPESGLYSDNLSQIPSHYEGLIDQVNNTAIVDLNHKENRQYTVAILLILLCIVILFGAIIFIYYGLLVRKYERKYQLASNSIKLSMILAEILRYLEKEGYHLTNEETLLNYAERIGDNIKFNQVDFLQVADLFMKVRYGENDIKEEELRLVLGFCNEFRSYLKEKLGKRKMFFDRFVFLHFY